MADSKALATTDHGELMERVIAKGDLAALTSEDRSAYYMAVCQSMGLNPLTKPFDYIELNKKLTLYATKTATDQIRTNSGVSVAIVSREVVDNVYVVVARATTADGRSDESVGAVPLVKENGSWQQSNNGKNFFKADGTLAPLAPEDRANAMMKAETKAKRRVTLSIAGLGWVDESETDSIGTARRVRVDTQSGEFIDTEARVVTPAAPDDQRPWSERIEAALAMDNGRRKAAFELLLAEAKHNGDEAQLAALVSAATTIEAARAVANAAGKVGKRGELVEAALAVREESMIGVGVEVEVEAATRAAVGVDPEEYDPDTGERIPDHVGRS